MSQENIEAMQRAIDAYNRRDVEAMLRELDPEVEWHSALPMLLSGQATVYRGHEGIRELFSEFDDVLDEIHVETTEIRDLGDRVVFIGRIRMRGKKSGIETESPLASVSVSIDGKAVLVRTYLDPKDALEAAGHGSSALDEKPQP